MRRLRSRAWPSLLLAAAIPLQAQEPAAPEEAGALFLLLPVGGRAAALGQAAAADGGTSEAAFWNPAGLALLPQSELALHYASTFASNNTILGAYLATQTLGVFGAAAYLVDYGSQEVTPGPGVPVGRISLKNIELVGSYATVLTSDLTLGVNYKLIQFRQDCAGDCGSLRTTVGTTHGVDLGMQYVFGSRDDLRIGVAVRHAGFRLQIENRDQADPLPTRLQVGMMYRVWLPRPAGMDQGLDARFLVDLQERWGRYANPDARVGMEVGLGELLRLRTGYAFLHSESRGPSIGVGFHVGRVHMDFARVFFDAASFDEPVHLSLRATL